MKLKRSLSIAYMSWFGMSCVGAQTPFVDGATHDRLAPPISALAAPPLQQFSQTPASSITSIEPASATIAPTSHAPSRRFARNLLAHGYVHRPRSPDALKVQRHTDTLYASPYLQSPYVQAQDDQQ
ncbi:hypothetical protein [Burkholderia ubonensis]|uniref:hypothetical protein n=1 Tax=Burkholderia ubonensis TaxID=101571 RepID=UPI000B33B411|nr:hypothetical protein [Burkholderia ubonensis]